MHRGWFTLPAGLAFVWLAVAGDPLVACAAVGDGLVASAASFSLLAQNQSVPLLPGAYLSWIKILLVAITFLIWVGTTDWVNRDAMAIGDSTGLKPEIWNPIVVVSFLIGFWLVISLPIFFVGYPLYLVSTLVPFMAYYFSRRSKVKANPGLAQKIKSAKEDPGAPPPIEPLPQDEGAEIEFAAAGKGSESQSNLIRARQSGAFVETKDLVDLALRSRADTLMLDYLQDRVGVQMLVDGAWHALPVMDRGTGDAILASLKYLAGVNPMERRAKQVGVFNSKTEKSKTSIELTSQGTQTGERALLKFARKKKDVLTFKQLGMFPEMANQFKQLMNAPGLCIVSAPPSQGLTTSWQGALQSAERMSRDCVGVFSVDHNETNVENIVPHTFDPAIGQAPNTILRTLLLTQPDLLAVPDMVNAETLDMLVNEANTKERAIITRVQANSAAEALLRIYAMSKDRKEILKALRVVTCQRLLRRLCSTCKQPYQANPNLIQQLGGNPQAQNTLFTEFRPPPPDMVDENGKPIEPPPPCPTCAALGYIGRVAAFEMIVVDDELRKVIAATPKVDAIEKAARARGKLTIINQGYKLVLLGITSLNEMQRVFKQK